MSEKNIMIVDTVEALEKRIEEVREAQRIFSTYSQEQVDKIFAAAALAANKARIPLAKQAVAETGMGIVEDKVIKNHYASEYIYNAYKDTKTCGVIAVSYTHLDVYKRQPPYTGCFSAVQCVFHEAGLTAH